MATIVWSMNVIATANTIAASTRRLAAAPPDAVPSGLLCIGRACSRRKRARKAPGHPRDGRWLLPIDVLAGRDAAFLASATSGPSGES